MIPEGKSILDRAMPRTDTLFIESDVKEFISRLPELSRDPPEVHLIMLAVRSKKAKELVGVKIKDLLVERAIVRPDSFWRRRYFSDVHNFAVLQHHGFYDLKETIEVPRIPPEAMGIMATISPRNVYFAINDLMRENIKYFYEHSELSGLELAKECSRFFGFLHQHQQDEKHDNKQKKWNYITIDIDTLDKTVFNDCLDRMSPFKKFMVTETSGGFHIVLNVNDKQSGKDFYAGGGAWEKLCEHYNLPTFKQGSKRDKKSAGIQPQPNVHKIIELQRDAQEPIVGTQYSKKGGEHFFVRFVE